MKILFPYMARWFAVNWTRYHSILEELGKLGHEVYVLQPPELVSEETNYKDIKRRDMQNIHLIDVPLNMTIWNKKFPLDKLFKKAYYSYKAYKFSKSLIKQYKIDTVLLYNIPQYQFMSLKEVNIVFDFADDYVDMLSYELGKFDNSALRLIAQKMLDKMMTKSDVVLSVSNELAKDSPGNIHVLPNGVNKEFLVDESTKSFIPDSDKIFTIGFLGSFEYFIDFDLIIDVARKLPNYRFLLVGSGRETVNLKTAISKFGLTNIELTGGVPHDQIFDFIDQMDICLNIFKPIPVSHRACPIKLFEYLSRKKPVITTRLHELVYIDSDNLLFYGDTSDEVVEQIEKIKDLDSDVVLKINKSYDLVRMKYTWEHIAAEFVELTK